MSAPVTRADVDAAEPDTFEHLAGVAFAVRRWDRFHLRTAPVELHFLREPDSGFGHHDARTCVRRQLRRAHELPRQRLDDVRRLLLYVMAPAEQRATGERLVGAASGRGQSSRRASEEPSRSTSST